MRNLLILFLIVLPTQLVLSQGIEFKLLEDLNKETGDTAFENFIFNSNVQVAYRHKIAKDNSHVTGEYYSEVIFYAPRNGRFEELCKIDLTQYIDKKHLTYWSNAGNYLDYMIEGRTNEIIYVADGAYFSINLQTGYTRLIKNFGSRTTAGFERDQSIVYKNLLIGQAGSSNSYFHRDIYKELVALNLDNGHYFLVKDIEDLAQMSSNSSSFRRVGDLVFFLVTDWYSNGPYHMAARPAFWVTDGTNHGTKLVKLNAGSSYTKIVFYKGQYVYYDGRHGLPYRDQGIFTYNYSSGTIVKLIDEVNFQNEAEENYELLALKVIQDKLYLIIERHHYNNSSVTSTELWESGGTNETTRKVATIESIASDNKGVLEFNNKLYFTKRQPVEGASFPAQYLFSYDGNEVAQVSNEPYGGLRTSGIHDGLSTFMASVSNDLLYMPAGNMGLLIDRTGSITAVSHKECSDGQKEFTHAVSVSHPQTSNISYPFFENSKLYWYIDFSNRYGLELFDLSGGCVKIGEDRTLNTLSSFTREVSVDNGTILFKGYRYSAINGTNHNSYLFYNPRENSAKIVDTYNKELERCGDNLYRTTDESGYENGRYVKKSVVYKADFEQNSYRKIATTSVQRQLKLVSVNGAPHFQSTKTEYWYDTSDGYHFYSLESDSLVLKYKLPFIPSHTTNINGDYYFTHEDNASRQLKIYKGLSVNEIVCIDTVNYLSGYQFSFNNPVTVENDKIAYTKFSGSTFQVLVLDLKSNTHKTLTYPFSVGFRVESVKFANEFVFIRLVNWSTSQSESPWELYRFGLANQDFIKYNIPTEGYESVLDTDHLKNPTYLFQRGEEEGKIMAITLSSIDTSKVIKHFNFQIPELNNHAVTSFALVDSNIIFVAMPDYSIQTGVDDNCVLGRIHINKTQEVIIERIPIIKENTPSVSIKNLTDDQAYLLIDRKEHGEELYTLRFCKNASTITGVRNGNYVRSSSGQINSTEQLLGDNYSLYIAPESINLNPGFMIKDGVFETNIGQKECIVTHH